jgi:hypothetical protein
MSSPVFDIAVLSRHLTKDTVALFHHDLEVQPLASGQPEVLTFPAAGEKNCPAVVQNISWQQSMLLLNKMALYHKQAGGVFGKEPLSLLEKWYSSHCNVSLLRAQCEGY